MSQLDSAGSISQNSAQYSDSDYRQPSFLQVEHSPIGPQDLGVSMDEMDNCGTFDSSSIRSEPTPGSPMFSSSHHPSHLPTPQSPNTLAGSHFTMGQYILDSPTSHLQSAYGGSSSQDPTPRPPPYKMPEEFRFHSPPNIQQILTPESSPHFLRGMPPPRPISAPQFGPLPYAEETPRASSSRVAMNPETAHRPSSPLSAPTTETNKGSPLSSPFMAKLSLSEVGQSKKPPKSHVSSSHGPIRVDDVFYSESNPAISTPPLSPPFNHHPGGELERLRLQMLDDELTHLQEAENRRPDYLKRSKRPHSESVVHADEERDHALSGIEIAVSPHKGRRLKLFQETSEESFEESLMAGGYGRYRTSEWLQQPQPTPSNAATPNIISLLEAEETPSAKELKKRKRLAAFHGRPGAMVSAAKLSPVKMGNRGRVLLDISAETPEVAKQLSPTKKRTSRRKSAAIVASPSADKLSVGQQASPDKPNWPDSEFPWRLRLEERAEMAKAEEAERLRWIEKFLDRDSDEDDEMEEDTPLTNDVPLLRAGRGKMVPLPVDPVTSNISSRTRRLHPSDPADARIALMSKRSVRALTHRKELRKARRRSDDDSNEEVVCICHGQDNGGELVQCDGCQIWYHLQCIGIKDVAELGREEDPWYCGRCSTPGLTRTPSPSFTLSSEPTFVKTTEEPTASLPFDLPFFQSSLQDSPAGPWNSHSSSSNTVFTTHFGSGLFSAESAWNDPKHGPSTPQILTHGSRLYATPGAPEPFGFEDSPFDPTSTPSRGIKHGAPPSFATPKNNTMWLARTNGLFQTPSKPARIVAGPGHVDSSSVEEQNSIGPLDVYRSLPGIDDSPVRRTKSGGGGGTGAGFGPAKITSQVSGVVRSPSLQTRSLLAQPFSTTEDWPGMDGKLEGARPEPPTIVGGATAVVEE